MAPKLYCFWLLPRATPFVTCHTTWACEISSWKYQHAQIKDFGGPLKDEGGTALQ